MKPKYIVTGLILVAALAAGIFFIRKARPVEAISQSKGADLKVKGAKDAKVEIVEFSDFQCPACKRAQPVLKNILSEYKGKVKLVYRHFPLAGHKWAALAHQAAECAHEEGVFWEYHDFLFDEQREWSKLRDPAERFLLYAARLGINLDSFAACLADTTIQRRVSKEKGMGERLQVRSTPTFFIDKDRVVGAVELKTKGIAVIRERLGLLPLASAESGE